MTSSPPAKRPPTDAIARSMALFEAGRAADALAVADAAIKRRPEVAGAHNVRGLALFALNNVPAAVASYDRALALNPQDSDAMTNRGTAKLRLGRWDEAMADLTAAVALSPTSLPAQFNLARGHMAANNVKAALDCYDRALSAQPAAARLLWAKGVAQLTAGDFAQGWQNYRYRWQAREFGHEPRDFGVPRLTGAEPLASRTILVHAEQGFGDTLQFCRFIPELAARGARVLFMLQPELKPLIAASQMPCTLFVPGDYVPPFDLEVPLLDLPAALHTTVATIPARVPYLSVPAAKAQHWTTLLGPRTLPRIGIAWSGRRSHIDDHARSLEIETLAPMFAEDAEFHVLQTDVTDAERKWLSGKARVFGPTDFADGQRDFGDAAAHVSAMDLVITVDTSLAHLAGALGKPVWILLAYAPDFRWMLERDDSPWYPTARLFRQRHMGDWAEVIARVHEGLGKRG